MCLMSSTRKRQQLDFNGSALDCVSTFTSQGWRAMVLRPLWLVGSALDLGSDGARTCVAAPGGGL